MSALYAGLTVDLLNRDTGEVQRVMLYPATRVELIHSAIQPIISTVYVVGEHTGWVETGEGVGGL